MHAMRYHKSGTSTVELNSSEEHLVASGNNVKESEDVAVGETLNEFGLLYLKCREKYFMPVSVIKNIMDDVVEFFVNTPEPEVLLDIENLWDSLKKEEKYKQVCYSYGFVEPIKVSVGVEGDKYYYVPILETLVRYISHDDVIASIEKNRLQFGDDILHDFTDGKYFLQSSFFNGNKNMLRIHLYVDEVEVCNPLGSSRGTHKLTCFYYTLGNVQVKYLSSLRNMHILAVVYSSVVKTYGHSAVLEKFCQDVWILEHEGISVKTTDGQNLHFYGGLATISGDNLGSHDIGGFRRCFNSGRICRFCMCVYSDLCKKCNEGLFVLRSQQMHDNHVAAVEKDVRLVAAYGVRGASPLNSLSSYHVSTGLPPDAMHDLLEGVLPIALNLILENLFQSNVLSKTQFHTALKTFKFGRSDSKKFFFLYYHNECK
uniref:uncharacterized protein LOC120335387 n=1 Tax=Styela clava TaxID=7725 RepID=UPI001939BDEC|nr:uncharacterized protein LOC120335387 [Styela clava]